MECTLIDVLVPEEVLIPQKVLGPKEVLVLEEMVVPMPGTPDLQSSWRCLAHTALVAMADS